MRRIKLPFAVIALINALAIPHAADAADAVADFYKNRTVQVIVGYGPGGGYDLYARALSRSLGKHIPGNPEVVPQNMPGAGGLKAMNYLYNVARKDGTVIATFARGLVIGPLLGHTQGTQFRATKFNWVGSISDEVSVCAFWNTSGIRNWEDMRMKPTTVGAAAAGTESEIFPTLMKNMFHIPMRVVTGYLGGGADQNLGMERGEIMGRCGWSWNSLVSESRPLLEGKKINITLQIAPRRHRDLPDVPAITEIPTTPENKAALKFITSQQSIARPFAAPPGVPADRINALRAAFDATMKDPEFLAETKRLRLDVRPLSGAEVENVVKEIYATPPDVVKIAAGATAK